MVLALVGKSLLSGTAFCCICVKSIVQQRGRAIDEPQTELFQLGNYEVDSGSERSAFWKHQANALRLVSSAAFDSSLPSPS
jgi:hypothetical protein